MRDLTAKQQLFVREYLVDLNATQAAIRAGYSVKTAEWIGPQLLGKTHVAAAIQESMDKRSEKVELNAEFVLSGLKQITIDSMADGDRKSALKGLELIGKHLKLFVDRLEHSGKLTLEDLLSEARGNE